jgi:outer membrane translocation and assembly module TamA
MDMALFYDAGKVASRREDLDFDNIQKDWGLGVRFHLPAYTFLRLEAARGSEGWHFVFASSAAF